MKKWPEDDTKTVYFNELVDPMIKAIEFGYKMERINEVKDIPYDGYDTEMEEQTTCYNPKETLSVKNLKFSLEDQGRTLLEEAIGIVFQLGVAQGKRILRNSMKGSMKLMKSALKIYEKESKTGEEKKLVKDIMSFFEMIEHNYQSLERFSKSNK